MEKRKPYWSAFNKNRDFFIIAEPDNALLSRLIMKAKGGRTLEKFSYDTGFCMSGLYSTLRGKRKFPIMPKDLLGIVAGAKKGCGITYEMLAAADGISTQESIDRTILEYVTQTSLARECVKDVPEEPYLNFGGKAKYMTKPVSEEEQFIRDMCFFCKNKNEAEIKKIEASMDELFTDKSFVQAAFRYHTIELETESAGRMQMQQVLNGSIPAGKQDAGEESASAYRKYMDEYLKKCFRAFPAAGTENEKIQEDLI